MHGCRVPALTVTPLCSAAAERLAHSQVLRCLPLAMASGQPEVHKLVAQLSHVTQAISQQALAHSAGFSLVSGLPKGKTS